VLVAAAGPASVDPQQVTVQGRHRDALRGVGVALGVVQHLLVAPARGSLHPRGQPVDQDRLAGLGHLRQPQAQVVQAGDEGPIGLADAERDQLAQQHVQAVADLALADPDHATRPPVGQPVEDDRPDRVQPDLQRDRPGPTSPAGTWGQVRQPGREPGQNVCGQR
jgi:hypothetical protein